MKINKCPTDPKKLINPLTGRCVIESNKTINKLLKNGWTIVLTPKLNFGTPNETKVFKVCPTDSSKLVNPETGRCVEHKNPVIQKLLKEGWTIITSSSRTLPVLVKNDSSNIKWKVIKDALKKNKESMILIDDYLADQPLIVEEEEEKVNKFEGLYRVINLNLFLDAEIVNNRRLQETTCYTTKPIDIMLIPQNPSDPPYIIFDTFNKPNLNYMFEDTIDGPILVNTPLSKSDTGNKQELIIYPDIINMIIKCNKRYLVMPLILWEDSLLSYFSITKSSKNIGSHANVLIFDIKNRTIERFDPHGSKFYSEAKLTRDFKNKNIYSQPSYNQTDIDSFMKSYFKKLLPDFQVKPIEYSCPYLGPQMKADVRIGYCVIWSIMYTFLRLLNPDVPPGTISRMLINNKPEQIKIILKKFAKYVVDKIKYSNIL